VIHRSVRNVVLALPLMLVAAACAGSSSSSSAAAGSTSMSMSASSSSCGASGQAAGGGDIQATEADFTVSLSTSTAQAGNVTFDVMNQGPSIHEFVVLKTDLPADQLPMKDQLSVEEEGNGIQHIDEIPSIKPCSSKSLSVNLKPGSYVVLCNLPGHYAQGMYASLTVS
jgi:uncharacterized cupredoxin-like copper-binding protein